MYLFINTTDAKKIFLALVDKEGRAVLKKDIKAEYKQSEKLLPTIERLLLYVKCQLSNVKGIIIVTGPGSFTALRIGLSTANALAWSLKIPIVGVKNCRRHSEMSPTQEQEALISQGLAKIKTIKKFKQVLPFYGQEPNTTFSKKRLTI